MEGLERIKEQYGVLRDQGEEVLLQLEKGEEVYSLEDKLHSIVERYHELGVADDDEHCSPYVYKNCLLLVNLGVVRRTLRTEHEMEEELEDLERVLFQLKCLFGKKLGEEGWADYIVPMEYKQAREGVGKYAGLVEELGERTNQLEEIASKLRKYTGEKEGGGVASL